MIKIVRRKTMKLSLENIGMIKNADVDLNGITVICGDNNTGKSTIGKALFCVFNSCYDIDNNIIRQMVYNLIIDINNEIRSFVINMIDDNERINMTFIRHVSIQSSINDFLKYFENLSEDIEEGKKQILYFFSTSLSPKYYSLIQESDEFQNKIYNLIKNTFKEPIKPHRLTRVKRYFHTVFDEQPVNIRCDKASVSAQIKEKIFRIETDKDTGTNLLLDIDFTNHAVFIDSPDQYKLIANDWNPDIHNSHTLNNLIQNEIFNDEDISDVNKTIIDRRASEVVSILNKAIKGKFKRNSNDNTSEFEFDGAESTIRISNLSTGVKSLLLFRTLCECGKLSPRDVLILDEPEIHLHPDWQLVYAEAIVVLQKELDLTVLITSHSPAFVRAIECYCDYYDRMAELDVYRTKALGNNEYTLENLSYMNYGISELYDDFSKPYSDLDDMLAEKHNMR